MKVGEGDTRMEDRGMVEEDWIMGDGECVVGEKETVLGELGGWRGFGDCIIGGTG